MHIKDSIMTSQTSAYLEDMLVEVELKLLVGGVDAELFEAVVTEVLEARDVQNSDPRSRGGSGESTHNSCM